MRTKYLIFLNGPHPKTDFYHYKLPTNLTNSNSGAYRFDTVLFPKASVIGKKYGRDLHMLQLQ